MHSNLVKLFVTGHKVLIALEGALHAPRKQHNHLRSAYGAREQGTGYKVQGVGIAYQGIGIGEQTSGPRLQNPSPKARQSSFGLRAWRFVVWVSGFGFQGF